MGSSQTSRSVLKPKGPRGSEVDNIYMVRLSRYK